MNVIKHPRPQYEYVLKNTTVYKLEHGWDHICKQLQQLVLDTPFKKLKRRIFKTKHRYITRENILPGTKKIIIDFYNTDYNTFNYSE